MNDVNPLTTSGNYLSVYNSDSINKVNILWTGGLDSTFRMLQLSKQKVTIQPYYLSDTRHSEQQELNAISSITYDIKNHPETRCTLLPLIIVKVAALPPDETISKAYRRLHKAIRLGSQFDWLARFASRVPGLELSMERSEMSKGYNCVNNFGRVKLINEGSLSYYVIDKDYSSEELIKVMGNFHFPYKLFHTTKSKEVELFKDLGFENTLYKTWFCHTPINNKPCGICHPCQSVVEEGLSFRLPPSALRRYERHIEQKETFLYEKLFRFWLKIYDQIHQHLNSPPSLLTNRALSHRI